VDALAAGELTRLAESAGFAVERCEYIQRETVNKKEGVHMPRIFVQAVFVRPADAQP
jgi:methyltransferase-like protein 6